MMDRFAQAVDAAVVMIHHATKGDQSNRSVTDMGAGGGSQSRTVDLQLVLRQHQQPELSILEAGLRSFTKMDPITVRFDGHSGKSLRMLNQFCQRTRRMLTQCRDASADPKVSHERMAVTGKAG